MKCEICGKDLLYNKKLGEVVVCIESSNGSRLLWFCSQECAKSKPIDLNEEGMIP